MVEIYSLYRFVTARGEKATEKKIFSAESNSLSHQRHTFGRLVNSLRIKNETFTSGVVLMMW